MKSNKIPQHLLDRWEEIIEFYKDHSTSSTCKKFNTRKPILDNLLTQHNIPLHTRVENGRLTCLEKYGVDNPTHTQEYKDRIKNRTAEDRKAINDKQVATNLKRYGVRKPLERPEILQKAQNTTMERFGVSNVSNSEVFRERISNALKEKFQSEDGELIKSKRRKTNLERYGVDNIFKSTDFKNKLHQDVLDSYPEEFKPYAFDRDRSLELLKDGQFTFMQLSVKFGITEASVESWIKRLNLREYIKPGRSFYEEELSNLFPMFSKRNNRQLLKQDGKLLEIDLFNEDNKVGIEFNGTYWHSDLVMNDKYYHFNKSKLAQDRGIRLIHIYEHEWADSRKRSILESMINLAIHNYPQSIYARNCEVKQITNKEAKDFNNKNHLQGHRNAQVTYGLFYNDELVQLMSFSKTKYNKNLKTDNSWEIIRGCPGSNNIVVGGVSKLFKHFIGDYDPDMIFSYCDFNKFDGKSYESLGMKFIGYTGPNKWWLLSDGTVVNRNPSKYKELKKISKAIIWGCGSKKYVWRKEDTV